MIRNAYLAAFLIAAAVPAQAQPVNTPTLVNPAVDTPAERLALRKLTVCFAALRPRWARAVLSYPYLSDPQASAAAVIVSGDDNCLGRGEVAVAFRTSGVVGALAENYLRAATAQLELERVSAALRTVTPLNVSEDFALCLTSRNPAAALNLVGTDPGSADETRAASVVATGVPACTRPTERLNVDLQSLRALVSTALYRAVAAANATRG